ncbi:glyoxalase/bleomycin resistance/extradiol dioxygenase family protein [Nitrososphaera sp.]|uniref:VOC family protein n=1 Tax=Nitrososphaera sp. TaxID=1971748 RepID=UPI0031714992
MTKVFVNLPVRDLKKTKEFFGRLRFSFNPMFTDDNAACMVISEDNYAMLLADKFFMGFIPGREICDAKSTEVLVTLSLDSRAEVDEIVNKAVAAGGSEYRKKQDYGWMYGRAFKDINGHIWEPFYMDMDAIPEEMKNKK